MTNLERIRSMSPEELVQFFKYLDFTRTYPVIEGKRLYSEQEVMEWFNQEAKILESPYKMMCEED